MSQLWTTLNGDGPNHQGPEPLPLTPSKCTNVAPPSVFHSAGRWKCLRYLMSGAITIDGLMIGAIAIEGSLQLRRGL